MSLVYSILLFFKINLFGILFNNEIFLRASDLVLFGSKIANLKYITLAQRHKCVIVNATGCVFDPQPRNKIFI